MIISLSFLSCFILIYRAKEFCEAVFSIQDTVFVVVAFVAFFGTCSSCFHILAIPASLLYFLNLSVVY